MEKQINYSNRHAFNQWKFASPFSRLVAFVVDCVLVLSLIHGTLILLELNLDTLGVCLLWTAAYCLWEGVWVTYFAATPGRKAVGIRVFSPKEDGTPHPLQVCLRIMAFWGAAIPFGAGLTPVLIRKDRRGWHELISETLTLGPKKSAPGSISQNVGQGLLMAQVLVSFAFTGALVVSQALKHKKDKNVFSMNCENPKHLVQNTSEVLTALAIAPSWSECWSQIQKNMASVSDSKLYEVAYLAHGIQHSWSLPKASRLIVLNRFMEGVEKDHCTNQEGQSSCETVRHLASLSYNKEHKKNTGSWVEKYDPLFRNLLKTENRSERIALLNQELNVVENKIVKSAILDRIWAEELASGKAPKMKFPRSMNKSWNQAQLCWLEALSLSDKASCQDLERAKIVNIIQEMKVNNLSENQLESLIIEFEEFDANADLLPVLRFAYSIKAEQNDKINLYWAAISELNPFYSVAVQFKNQYLN